MLAMRDEEAFVMFSVFLLIGAATWMGHRAKLKHKRLQVIEKALESPMLDDLTRRSLLDALGAEDRNSSAWTRALGQHLTFLGRNLLFLVGWMTMFVGAAFWLVNTTIDDDRYSAQGGMIATIVGFGLVTLPMALRELDRRHAHM